MYPQTELNELAQRKVLLHQRIAGHRAQCVASARVVAVPLTLIDRGLALWRQLSPLLKIAALPFAGFVKQNFTPGDSGVGSLLRWVPTVLGMWRENTSSKGILPD